MKAFSTLSMSISIAVFAVVNILPPAAIFASANAQRPQSQQANPNNNDAEQQAELMRLEQERQSREQRLNALEQNADQAAKEINELQQRLVDAAINRDNAEKTVEQSVAKLRQLKAQEQDAESKLVQRRTALENVVVALIAVEQDRPPALAVEPQNATEAARVAILMRLVAPMLNQRAQQISNELGRLRKLREDILMSNDDYRKANTYLQNSKQTIAVLITQRQLLENRLRQDANTEQKAIDIIANRANNLRELINQVGEVTSNALNDNGSSFASNFDQQKGSLIRPALGIIMNSYGSRLEEGGTARGMTMRTSPSAQVVAPYDAKVEFAAPFRSYGKVVILNVGGKYRIILAGIGASYVEAGQEVLAGEPIGEMPADNSGVNSLYVEFRNGNTTLDPAPWFKKDRQVVQKSNKG